MSANNTDAHLAAYESRGKPAREFLVDLAFIQHVCRPPHWRHQFIVAMIVGRIDLVASHWAMPTTPLFPNLYR